MTRKKCTKAITEVIKILLFPLFRSVMFELSGDQGGTRDGDRPEHQQR